MFMDELPATLLLTLYLYKPPFIVFYYYIVLLGTVYQRLVLIVYDYVRLYNIVKLRNKFLI